MRIFLAIVATIFSIGSATAADAWSRASSKDLPAANSPAIYPVETARQSWTAVWGAVLAGYSMSNTRISADVFEQTEGGTESFNLGRFESGGEGWDFTGQIGGDIEVRGLVAGAFAEYSFGGIDSEASVFGGFGRLDVEQQDSYCFLGRLGVARGETLFYGASGYCHTEVEAKLTFDGASETSKLEFDGVPLEFGIEHRFSPNMRARLAGRYTWFGEETVAGSVDDGARVTAEPGLFAIKAGLVITTGGEIDPLN